jgi:hypothetical protein
LINGGVAWRTKTRGFSNRHGTPLETLQYVETVY